MIEETRPANDMRYQGGAFHPDLESGKASGTVRISPAGVCFDSPNGRFELPLEGLQVALGGANDRLVFFTHPDRPYAAIHTADHSVLKHPVLAARPELTAQVGRVQSRQRHARVLVLSVIAALIALIAGVVLAKDRIVESLANSIPTQWEVSLGNTLFEQMIRNEREVTDPDLTARLRKITDPLVNGINDSRYPFQFHIIEDPTVNAFAIPGGHVVIHSGLLLAADTPEEVAGVLAHEIAHITRRHGFRSLISSLGLYQVLQMFVGDATSLLAVLANNGAFLLDLKFSRDFEREADAVGWEYLLRANIDPGGMVEFFKTLEAEEKKTLGGLPGGTEKTLSLVSTHPATLERRHTLESKLRRLDRDGAAFHKFDLNYDSFKAGLRSKLHSAPEGTE